MRGFGSDNHAGVHPKIMAALMEANQEHAPSYGTDPWTEKTLALFKREFGPQSQTFFVFNGTAANVTSLRALMRPWESAFVSDCAHLEVDECAAPEFFTGGKLLELPSHDGKLLPETLSQHWIRKGDQHYAQTRVLSLTQPTELGTCYSVAELEKLVQWAHSRGLFVHMDGARFVNAAEFLKVSFHELTTKLGIDVLSFGGTKNGLMMGEAVVFLNPKLAEGFIYLRKQSAQLPSKTRFIAAQFEAYLSNDLCRQIASWSHSQALALRQGLESIADIKISIPTESNAVFAKIPPKWVRPLREKFFFYVWNEHSFECRLMTAWDTQSEDVQKFLSYARELSASTTAST